MQTMSKKTTILFPPELYQQLKETAKMLNMSVAKLIRQAVIDRYLLSDKNRRAKAIDELSQIGAPVSNWETMEQDSITGKLKDLI